MRDKELRKDYEKAYRIANELGFQLRKLNKDGSITVYPPKRSTKEIDNDAIDKIVEIIRE